jgi:hypothetical protein
MGDADAWPIQVNHEPLGRPGTVNWNMAPRGAFVLAHKRPACASMIERQIDRPNPNPPGLVV